MSHPVEDRPMPRLFVIRHGETEWSMNGRHTGRSDIPLTENGIKVITSKADEVVGHNKLIDPRTITKILISPRQRARKTFESLFSKHTTELECPHDEEGATRITEAVREWDYGDYEGLKPDQIEERQPGWKIWSDGCPGGESVEEMTARVDSVIADVREIHRKYKEEGIGKRDIMIFSHGHFSRVLISRWMEFTPALGTHFNVEPGGIALLCYNHHNLKEPSLNGLNLYAY